MHGRLIVRKLFSAGFSHKNITQQPQTGLISRFYQQVENRLKKNIIGQFLATYFIRRYRLDYASNFLHES